MYRTILYYQVLTLFQTKIHHVHDNNLQSKVIAIIIKSTYFSAYSNRSLKIDMSAASGERFIMVINAGDTENLPNATLQW